MNITQLNSDMSRERQRQRAETLNCRGQLLSNSAYALCLECAYDLGVFNTEYASSRYAYKNT